MLYHIDSDFGTDDALAFVAADSLLSEQVIGISAVAGNVSLDKALRVASLLLPLLPKLAKYPCFAVPNGLLTDFRRTRKMFMAMMA